MAQIGVDLGSYVFVAATGTITFVGVTIDTIEQIKPIINGKTGNVIFNPAESGKFGTLTANTLSLDYDTSTDGSLDTDGLYVFVNIPNNDGQGQTLDTNNTQVITLTEAQVGVPWQGDWTLTRSIGVVRILTVLASTDQTEGGLGGTFVFEFSEDGITNNGISESRIINDFQTVRDFDLINAGAYYRCSFEPDRALVSDSVFVTTTLRKQDDGAFVRLADQQIEKANAAMPQTFAYLKGFKPNGKSSDVLMNPEGQLIFGDYNVEVARDSITGARAIRIEARNESVGTTEQIIWAGGAAYNFLTTADTVRVRSGGNANDTLAGSGARVVTFVGLDTNGNEITESVNTLGALASLSTTASFRRINDVYVSSAGTYATGAIATGSNTGAITLETTGGTLLGVIPANVGRGGRAVYTVPLNKKGYLKRLRCTPEGSKAVTFKIWTRKNFDVTSAPVNPKMLRAEWKLITTTSGFELVHPIVLDEKEEVWVSAQTGTGTSAASVAFEIELLDD